MKPFVERSYFEGYGGLRVVRNGYLCTKEQVGFPRSKKRRIKKKFKKNQQNYVDVPLGYGILMGDVLMVHPFLKITEKTMVVEIPATECLLRRDVVFEPENFNWWDYSSVIIRSVPPRVLFDCAS